MADPVTILISLAPFILDLLFGEGHSMKHRKINPTDNKMDKALLMSGGAYPRRKDYIEEGHMNKDKYILDYAKEYAKLILREVYNPWILFLEKKRYLDRLQELKNEYERLKEEKGLKKPKSGNIPLPLLDRYLDVKSLQIDKLKKVKELLEQISSEEPNPVQDEFKFILEDEYNKANKMGFTEIDISNVFAKSFDRLLDRIELAEEEYKRQQARKQTGTGRVSYKTMSKELARKHGFRLPRSARQHGKTWKEIYMDLITGLK
jgi:hypothetical protein